jgi:hypothetical protein
MPGIAMLSPESKTCDTTDVPLNFTADETVSWMTYSTDSQANVTVAGKTTLSRLPEGSHTLEGHATDTAGNTGASETVVQYFNLWHENLTFSNRSSF